jgi:hypothetical protein
MTETLLRLGVLDFIKLIYEGHPEYSLIAVKAPIDQVVPAFISFREAQTTKQRMDYKTFRNKELKIIERHVHWEQEIALQLGSVSDEENDSEDEGCEWGMPFLQVAESEWTVILRSLSYLGEDEIKSVPQEAKALSETLQTQAITLMEEDTSAAIGYILFELGEQLEKFDTAPGCGAAFTSTFREEPELLSQLRREDEGEEEDEDDWNAEYDVSKESRVQLVDQLYRQLGIYLPACWPFCLEGKPAMQIEAVSDQTIARADWLVLRETLQDSQVEADEDDAE